MYNVTFHCQKGHSPLSRTFSTGSCLKVSLKMYTSSLPNTSTSYHGKYRGKRDTVLNEDLAIILFIRLLALQLHQQRLSGIYSATSVVVFWQRRKGRGLTRCGLFLDAVKAKLQRVSAICQSEESVIQPSLLFSCIHSSPLQALCLMLKKTKFESISCRII